MSSAQLLSTLREKVSSYEFPDIDQLDGFQEASNEWFELISEIIEALANESFEGQAQAIEAELQGAIADMEEELAAQQEVIEEQAKELAGEDFLLMLSATMDAGAAYRKEADLTNILAGIYAVKDAGDRYIPGLKTWLEVWITAATTFAQKQEASKELLEVEELAISKPFFVFNEYVAGASKLSSSVIKKAFAKASD